MANKSIVSQIFCSLTIAISNHFPYIHSGKHLHPLFSFHCCNLSRCHLEIDFGWINNLQNFKQKNKFDFPFLILSKSKTNIFVIKTELILPSLRLMEKLDARYGYSQIGYKFFMSLQLCVIQFQVKVGSSPSFCRVTQFKSYEGSLKDMGSLNFLFINRRYFCLSKCKNRNNIENTCPSRY